MLSVYPLQSTVKGILGSQGPAKDDSKAREEAEIGVSILLMEN
jgi:hypothetical protein